MVHLLLYGRTKKSPTVRLFSDTYPADCQMNQLHIVRYLLFLYGTYFSQDLADFYDSNSVGGFIKRTPKGLAFRNAWGANRFAANRTIT